jgi:hypothetical protein
MGKMIKVGCRLPHGIVLEHPANESNTVTLAGQNRTTVIGMDYATTEVDSDFWEAWYQKNKKFPALVSGAIFVARNLEEVIGKGKDLAKSLTGFEPVSQEAHGVKVATAEM